MILWIKAGLDYRLDLLYEEREHVLKFFRNTLSLLSFISVDFKNDIGIKDDITSHIRIFGSFIISREMYNPHVKMHEDYSVVSRFRIYTSVVML